MNSLCCGSPLSLHPSLRPRATIRVRSPTLRTVSCARSKLERRRSKWQVFSGDPDFASSEGQAELGRAVSEALRGTNVYLVGMMGSGKSTVGKRLAGTLRYRFMDTDSLIEEVTGMEISEVFAKSGEEDFRKLETAVLRDVHQYTKMVVGTGGGIVIDPMNWSYLQQGVVVFLSAEPGLLAQRVAGDGLSSRPLLSEEQSGGLEETKKKLRQIFDQREKMYKNADIEVSIADSEAEDGLAPVDDVLVRVLTALFNRLEESKRERQQKRRFDISGAAEMPGGGLSVNPPSEGEAEGF